MKTIIVYYSFTQNNEKLARLLQRRLGCDLLKIEELKKRTRFTILFDLVFNRLPAIKTNLHNLKEYDQVIFVAPVWAAKIASPLKTFIMSERENISNYGFITVCTGAAGQQEKITRQLGKLTGKKPEVVLELSIDSLFRHSKEKAILYSPDYRVSDEDFIFFEPIITEFLGKSAMPLAPGWQVKSEYGD